ncbi:hypothetical protein DM02DRAFT_627779 [Periconia macrospinosa]|uniref:CCHC-type domain-containing protein n=1 Tax=Periconia macrospinosa TaxID=97972 RepID=A0A2V1DSH3_9PLEO|nr:hypothetical protein DM02DRAFT_627779 [Periconia macrospinosa]
MSGGDYYNHWDYYNPRDSNRGERGTGRGQQAYRTFGQGTPSYQGQHGGNSYGAPPPASQGRTHRDPRVGDGPPMDKPNPESEPHQFGPPPEGYTDQSDLPEGVGKRLCGNCFQPGHDSNACWAACATCGNRSHIGRHCPQRWLSWDFYNTKLRHLPRAYETNVKIRPSPSEAGALLAAGHTWASKAGDVHKLRESRKRSAVQAELPVDSGRQGKTPAAELDVIHNEYASKLEEGNAADKAQLKVQEEKIKAQDEELTAKDNTIAALEAVIKAQDDVIRTQDDRIKSLGDRNKAQSDRITELEEKLFSLKSAFGLD